MLLSSWWPKRHKATDVSLLDATTKALATSSQVSASEKLKERSSLGVFFPTPGYRNVSRHDIAGLGFHELGDVAIFDHA
jgi:hypothetical protein